MDKSALIFHNTHFNVIDRHGQSWLTSAEIAQALEYAGEKSVSNLYARNADEFTPAMTQVITLMTSGNYQKEVRIFSLRGAHLIGMFARTPIAKEFRQWVLDILERESNAEKPKVAHENELVHLSQALAKLRSVRALMVFDLVSGTHQITPIDEACMVANPRVAQDVKDFLRLVPPGLLPDVLRVVSVPTHEGSMVVNPCVAQEVKELVYTVPLGILREVMNVATMRLCGGLQR